MARVWKFRGPEGLPYSYEGEDPPTREEILQADQLALDAAERAEGQGAAPPEHTPVARWETEEGEERARAAGRAVAGIITGGVGTSKEEYDEAGAMGLIDPERASGTPGAATGLVPRGLTQGAVMLRDVAEAEAIRYAEVELRQTPVLEMRRLQDAAEEVSASELPPMETET